MLLFVNLEIRFWNRFLGGWNLKFSVDYDRAKCQERVGKNGIENGLMVWILRAKTRKLENLRLSVRQKSDYDFRHRATILTRFWGVLVRKNRITMGKYRATILPDYKLSKCIILQPNCFQTYF